MGADDAVSADGVPALAGSRDLIRVEEYREDGTLVVRADLPGIDADKDVELTVADGSLHIKAERRQEEKRRATCGVRCATGRCLGRCRYRRA